LSAAIAIILALSDWSDLVLQVGGYCDGLTPHPVENLLVKKPPKNKPRIWTDKQLELGNGIKLES